MYKLVFYKVSYLYNKKLEFITYTSLEALSDFIYMLSTNGGTLYSITRKVKILWIMVVLLLVF